MKKYLVIAALITVALNSNAQIYIILEDTSSVYHKVDADPQFPGGLVMFDRYIDNNSAKILKPNHALGTIVLSFFVEKTGKITSPRVIKGLTPETDTAAIYLIRNSPLWKPGVANGVPVKTFVKIAVKFFYPGNLRPVHVQDVVLSKGQNADVLIDEPVGASETVVRENDPSKIYSSVERVPQFPGGMLKFKQWVNDNKKITNIGSNGSGKVIISLVVEMDGSLTDIKIIRSLRTDCDSEALRLMKQSPRWQPGMLNGKPVRTAYYVSVPFEPNN